MLHLLQGFLHILVGPSMAYDANNSCSTCKGNAAIHGIWAVSIYSIAYTATIVCVEFLSFMMYMLNFSSKVHFVLSDQSTLTAGGPDEKGHWPYEEFYKALIKMMEKMDEDDLDDLLV